MGTAPDDRQSAAMPDPVKLVSRSWHLLSRLGLGDEAALATIIYVAAQVKTRLIIEDTGTVDWVSLVINDAVNRLAVLTPSSTEPPGDDHADGRSSRPGRTAQDQD